MLQFTRFPNIRDTIDNFSSARERYSSLERRAREFFGLRLVRARAGAARVRARA